MRYIVRSVQESDLDSLYGLVRHDELVHLPPDKNILEKLISSSIASFVWNPPPENRQYVFVLEDVRTGKLAGASLIIAQYVSKNRPYHYFQVLRKETSDRRLNRNGEQSVLRLAAMETEMCAIGGLVVDPACRGTGEKLGRQIALSRFVYMGMFPERFEEKILCEFMAPRDKNGANLFWDAVGRHYTGMDFEQALDLMRADKKNVIGKMLPEGDIYLSRLDRAAHPSADRLHPRYGKAVRNIEESLGFRYINGVDFDGGPLYQAIRNEIGILKRGGIFKVDLNEQATAGGQAAWVGRVKAGRFRGGIFPCHIDSQTVLLSEQTLELLEMERGEQLYLSFAHENACNRFRGHEPGFVQNVTMEQIQVVES